MAVPNAKHIRSKPAPTELETVERELHRKQDEVFQLLNKQRILLRNKVITFLELGYASDNPKPEELIDALPTPILTKMVTIIDRLEKEKK